jgi:hypothetical protein
VYAKAQAKVNGAEVAAREAADQARKASAYSALWLCVSLLIGAFVAAMRTPSPAIESQHALPVASAAWHPHPDHHFDRALRALNARPAHTSIEGPVMTDIDMWAPPGLDAEGREKLVPGAGGKPP